MLRHVGLHEAIATAGTGVMSGLTGELGQHLLTLMVMMFNEHLESRTVIF
jgi:hypothetical protein